MKTIKGLSEIAFKYDGLIVDAWGVLHDGRRPFEQVEETLTHLNALHKNVIIVTNSPSRKTKVIIDLHARGIDPALYSDVISSGEVAFQEMQKRFQKRSLPRKCFFLGQEKHLHLTDGLDLILTSTFDAETFLLNAGPVCPSDALSTYQDVLNKAREDSVEMICVNPDRMAFFQGQQRLCAGEIAKQYESMGGGVSYYGKPFPCIYQYIWKQIDSSQRWVAIGDSLETDITGGIGANIDTVLVFTGVTAKKKSFSPSPTYCMEKLQW